MLLRRSLYRDRHHLLPASLLTELFSTDSSSDSISYICSGFETTDKYNISTFKKHITPDSTKFTLIPLPKVINEAILLKLPKLRSRDDADSLAFVFNNGVMVTWNVPKKELAQLKHNLIQIQFNSLSRKPLRSLETEELNYRMSSEGKTGIYKNEIVLHRHKEKFESYLEKYAFSHAIALSLRLAMWERLVDNFISSIYWIPNALKNGKKIQVSRSDILKKTGELLSIRYEVNLSSDLFHAPDCFWDSPALEELYNKMSVYLDVKTRGRIITEMMNHCSAIVDLLRTHLNERHSFRLEWGIIILIFIEVMFEILHYLH